MVEIIITKSLEKEIDKKFKKESVKVVKLIYSLKKNHRKGKVVGQIGGILIKELKYKNFRFYFIIDGYNIKFLEIEKLRDLIIKFVRMSDKKTQQKIINDIKYILRNLGEDGF